MTEWVLALYLTAGSAPAVRMTLAEAVERARDHAPRLAQLHAQEQAAEAGERGARAARLPALDLNAGYSRNSNVPELVLATPGQPPRTVFPSIPDQYRLRAGLSLPLLSGGRMSAGVDAAADLLAAARSDRLGAEHDLVLETITTYWSLVTARQSESVLAEAIATFEAHLKDARNRQELGLAARNEVLAVQVERDRAELDQLRAAAAAALAQDDLARLTGLAEGTPIEAAEPAGAGVPAPEPLAALQAAAVAQRPELRALRARADAAEASVRSARSSRQPQLGLSAGFDYANPNPRILPLAPEWKTSWSVGLSASWTAFDGGRTAAAMAQASAQAEATRHQLADLEARVRLEVAARRRDRETAEAALALASRGLEAARENARVAQDRHREGLIAFSERLDAELALLHAGLQQTASSAELRLASARLERAVGK
jgi:outer membrane protein